MNGIVINIDPIALQFGSFALRWYSIFVVLAIIGAVTFSVYEGKRKGIPADEIYSLAPWVLIGGVVGARLFHVIDQWQYYAAHLLQIFWVQQGGLAIWGAMAGGVLAAIIFARARHIAIGRLFDVLAPGLLIAQIIGRFGCIINGDAYGGVTGLPWGFIYTNPGAMVPPDLFGVPTHPYPIYEMLWNGLLLFFVLKNRNFFRREGLLFLAYLAYYGLGRFMLTFIRQEKIWFWGLQEAQVVAIAIMVFSIGTFIYLALKTRTNAPSEGIA